MPQIFHFHQPAPVVVIQCRAPSIHERPYSRSADIINNCSFVFQGHVFAPPQSLYCSDQLFNSRTFFNLLLVLSTVLHSLVWKVSGCTAVRTVSFFSTVSWLIGQWILVKLNSFVAKVVMLMFWVQAWLDWEQVWISLFPAVIQMSSIHWSLSHWHWT